MNDAEHRIDPEEAVAAAIDAAEEVDDPVADEAPEKPRLLVEKATRTKQWRRCEIFLLKLAGFMTEVFPSASPSTRPRRARLRR